MGCCMITIMMEPLEPVTVDEAISPKLIHISYSLQNLHKPTALNYGNHKNNKNHNNKNHCENTIHNTHSTIEPTIQNSIIKVDQATNTDIHIDDISTSDSISTSESDSELDSESDSKEHSEIHNEEHSESESKSDSESDSKEHSESDSEEHSKEHSESDSKEHSEEHSDYFTKEYKYNSTYNKSYEFTDIIDDKHVKYMNQYETSETSETPTKHTLFWGIGIENESYFMFTKKHNNFPHLTCKRERYSVDYFKNFKPDPLKKTLETLVTRNNVQYPVYVNSHTFQSTDKNNEHRTIYGQHPTLNPKFIESIHDVLMKENDYYKKVYNNSVVFDGDTIEFITQNFYNTTVSECVEELCTLKQEFLKEISPYFTQWDKITFPDHNYGIVSFLSTSQENMGICNNGTLHMNITLPTILDNGIIVNKHKFADDHIRLISYIQMLEPLLVACYGTPDVFSTVDENALGFSIGSLRVTFSRYISLQTFDVNTPINGKLLLMPKPDAPEFWYNQFQEIPYFLNKEIGYDINFNKFKNHGIELRFFEWFPEKYIADVLNLIILVAEHSHYVRKNTSSSPIFIKTNYNSIILGCVRKGFMCILTKDECNIILSDLQLDCVNEDMSPHSLLTHISTILYNRYSQGEIVKLMSPNMKQPNIVNYNKEVYQLLYTDLHSAC